MRPVPIPDDLVQEGQVRKVIGAPPGREDSVAAIEALAEVDPTTGIVLAIRMVLEEPDVERIALGERHFWFQSWGDHLHPFNINLGEKPPPHECQSSPPPEALRDAVYRAALRVKLHRGLSEHDEALMIEFASKIVEDAIEFCPCRLVRPVCSCGTTTDHHAPACAIRKAGE